MLPGQPGIGRAFAEACSSAARQGLRRPRDVAKIIDQRVVPVRLDVTDPDRFAALARELDDVRLVVNNAGIGHVGFPLQAALDTARRQLEVNYLGLVSSTQAFAPALARNGGGAFVNVLSALSWVAMPPLTTYSASKAAAWSYTNAARVELKQQGTQVVGVHVRFVDTDLTAPLDIAKVPPAVVAAAHSTPLKPASRRRSSTSTAEPSRPASATTSEPFTPASRRSSS